MLNIYPFENQLYVMRMSGKEILDYLEYSYSQWVYSMNSSEDKMLKIQKRNNSNIYSFINRSYNFDSASGILYEVDLTKPIGQRVMIKSMSNGTSFDLNKTYNVALSSYRANGGGEILEMGSKLNATERDKRVVKRMADIRDLLFDYIKKEQVLKPLNLKEWSFTPIEFSSEAKKREYQLIFPK
jgi:2',3'-cyclic-nucleotide 2'-phosphodiesterase/3'-nucleotidase